MEKPTKTHLALGEGIHMAPLNALDVASTIYQTWKEPSISDLEKILNL